MADDEGKKKKRKHLTRVRTEEAHDGSFVHHHTYKSERGDPNEESERKNVATSSSPEEAGQHVAEQFGMNQPPEAGADPGAAPPEAVAADPAAAMQQ